MILKKPQFKERGDSLVTPSLHNRYWDKSLMRFRLGLGLGLGFKRDTILGIEE